jgi:hypothetical protein
VETTPFAPFSPRIGGRRGEGLRIAPGLRKLRLELSRVG